MQNGVKLHKRAAERIRETAEELFYREGIRAVGVDEIVARAGVTKPSLYRSYASKDELVADCLRHHGAKRLEVFDAALAQGNDVRAAFRAWLAGLSERATQPDYRGCGNSNAVVEYPHLDHPARKVAAENKSRFRARLHALAKELGAPQPGLLGDMLLLLIEGSYTSGQLFGVGGPASRLVQAVDMMIDAHLDSAGKRTRGDVKPTAAPKRNPHTPPPA